MRRCFVLVAAWLLVLSACYSGTRPPRIGERAPDFTVQDGQNRVALHDLLGKVVVLNFWASWCPPCVEEMPSLAALSARMKQRGVQVVAISTDTDPAAYQNFIRQYKLDFTVRDADQRSNALYGTYKFPETYIIDAQGVVRRKFIGPVDWSGPEIVSYLQSMSAGVESAKKPSSKPF